MAYTGEVHSSDYSDILDVVKQVLAGSYPGDKIYIEVHGDIAECDGSDDSYFVEAHRWNEFDEDEEDEPLSKCGCEKCNSDGPGCGIEDDCEKKLYDITVHSKENRDDLTVKIEAANEVEAMGVWKSLSPWRGITIKSVTLHKED
jgi:hypothetical protein